MIEFNTGKYFGEETGDGGIDIFSSDKKHRLFTIEPGSKVYSYIDGVLKEGELDRDGKYLINCEINDELKRLDADLGEEPENKPSITGQLII